MKKSIYFFGIAAFVFVMGFSQDKGISEKHPNIISHEVDLSQEVVKMYWKDTNGLYFKNFKRLKKALAEQGKALVFAMNGGMYLKDGSPQGLYIANGKVLKPLDTAATGYGNFYLQPNGVFTLFTNKSAAITTTKNFQNLKNIAFVTQSGPMLVIQGAIHHKFTQGSKNLHIRNGVGILPNGNVLFAMSTKKINFYDFAQFFKSKGCQNALYLDGFVSRMYLPEKDWIQEDGSFGVIIGTVKNK